MKAGGKIKVSVSLSPKIVERIDKRARKEHSTRSAVVEKSLWASERQAAGAAIAAEVEAYYRGQSEEERTEDEAIAAASSRVARSRDLDEDPHK
jgi:predicted transcriptional regulator